MTISISSSVLLSYLQVQTGQDGQAGASTVASKLAASAPVAPWSSQATATSATSYTTSLFSAPANSTDTTVEQILAGKAIVDPSQAKLSQTTSSTSANTDYDNLFALYQGLTTLQSLATAAGSTSTTSTQLKLIEQAFTSGLGQVRSFIAGDPFQEFAVSDGTVSSDDMSSVAVQQSSDTYDTAPLVKVSPNDVVASLSGQVAFSMTAKNAQGKNPVTVNFNLNDMGSTPRTLSNVVSYLNGQLQAAGLKTRFATNLIPGQAAVTTTSAGLTTTVTAATPDQYGLQINGTPNELLSFSAASTTPSVYIAQTSFDPSATTTSSTTSTTTTTSATTFPTTTTSGTSSTAATVTSQLIKLDQPSSAGAATTRGFSDSLPAGATITATASAPDGSTYVLANVDQTINGQTIQGPQDAALLKYDSAGQLIYTRTLGSADTVDATALAVSADGSQVAIAGSVTGGALDPTDTSQDGSTTAQSFVSVYDSAGDQLWDYTQDGDEDNQANAVSFGANNSVYIAGQTMGRLPGATSAGAQDGYVQGFDVTASTDRLSKETTYTATSAFTQEFGTSGVDRATGVAVNGSNVYVSSVENGDAVVRQFKVTSSTASRQVNAFTTATSTTYTAAQVARQDLGALTGGNVSGVAVASDGTVVVAGSTHDAALTGGSITNAYSGNGDAFVARLNGDIASTSADSLAYYNTGQPTTATALTVDGTTAYITGQIDGQSTTTPAQGYAAAIGANGQVGWSTTFTGNNGSADPSSIAVANTGASALDLLGLPQGAVQQQSTPSQLLVANSSVQAGDYFYVQSGSGTPQKVTIAADDTYETLAQKIQVASGYNATVTTMTLSSGQQLKIAPANSSDSIRIEAGGAGQDALAALGLKEGLVSDSALDAAPTMLNGVKVTSNIKSHYSVTVPDSLSLSTPAGVQQAKTTLATAIADVQSIYTDMTSPKPSATTGGTSGSVPSYITAQISNYQLALSRLTGSTAGSSTTESYSGSSAALAILGG